MKAVIGVIIAIIILGGGYYFYSQQETEFIEKELPKVGDVMDKEEGLVVEHDGDAMPEDVMEEDDTMMKKDGDAMDEDVMEKEEDVIMKKIDDISGVLEDVSGGDASGVAKAGFIDGGYTLVATFEGLTDPEGTDFYEGWIVRRGDDMNVISTGKVLEEETGYINHYTADENLLDHDFYIVTIEPDDGDPAPAVHILEGVMQ